MALAMVVSGLDGLRRRTAGVDPSVTARKPA